MYDIVDHDGDNLVGSYGTEEEALDMICRTIRRSGRDRVRQFELFDGHGRVAKGAALARRALNAAPAKRSA